MIHMQKKCVLACLLAVMLMLIACVAYADTAVVTATSLYLRTEPNSDSASLKLLRNGTKLEVLGKSGDWYKVSYSNGKYIGYVFEDYVTVTKEDGVLSKGDTGSAVKAVQQRLRELGYYSATCDGNYGNVTVTAVKAFQKKNGLTQDGIVNEATLKKLNSSSAISAKGTTVGTTVKDDGVLNKGDKGNEVKALQQRLKELGYYKSTCDGQFGDVTVSAVKAFQKKNGLTADGVAGETTLKKLNSDSAIMANGKPAKEEVKDDGILNKGDKGEDVKKLQQRLKELGYYKSTCDSQFGDVTVSAVKAFQKKNGLTADGAAGDATLKKLYADTAIRADGTPANSVVEDDDDTLEMGDKGTQVRALQQRLKDLGYYKNGIDGSYGAQTAAAVKAFQKNNGLTADGVAGPATLKKLESNNAVDANGPDSETLKTSQTLKSGNSGAQVKLLQKRLKELGYYTTTVDGDYGYRTIKAVSDFQKNNGLTVDGVAGPSTLVKLVSDSAKKAGEGTTNNTNDDTLEKGDSGDSVKKLQQRLKELGYYTSYCDGSYGDRTASAVKAFQKNNGLTQDGIAGPSTQKKLYSESAISAGGSTGVTLDTSKTLKKGDSGAQVKALQLRLKELGYYTTTVDSDYGYKTAEAVSAFQKANKLTVSGTADTTTLKKLVSSSAISKSEADKNNATTTIKTERLDWFNGGKAKFAGRPIIEIKDVRTGMVFKGKVLYGTNHLDVEPLTAADTATLLAINGGVEFKYYRRPMLVKHNGHVYAASIYSEPHGQQTIYDNNFEGQFCLHFYGSMTHGTDVVDSKHQECVAEAMKATW